MVLGGTVLAAFSTLPGPNAAGAVTPAAFYVATTGDDSNACTALSSACATVNRAITLATQALTGSATSAVVNVAVGTYPENVRIPSVAAGKSLSVVGAGAPSTTINPSLKGVQNTGPAVIVQGGEVNLSGLAVTGGDARPFSDDDSGGGIDNFGTLAVTASTISGNVARYFGGGIENNGTLTVTGSAISHNTSYYEGGGIDGGGRITVTGSTISGNSAGRGGGIDAYGTLTVTESTIDGNGANEGAGVESDGAATVARATIADNGADFGAGGILNDGYMAITESTISDNNSTVGDPGISNFGGTITVAGSTISGNHKDTDAGIPSGGIANHGGVVTVAGSILSGDTTNGSPQECSGSVTDGGYNVTSDTACGFGNTSLVSSVSSIGLAPLAANGSNGPQTMALTVASSAHSVVPVANCAATDERGLPRPGFPAATTCDAWAFELQHASTTTSLTATPGSPAVNQAVTLTAAVHYPGSAPAPTGTVSFYDGTLLLGTAPLTAAGPGVRTATLSATFGTGTHELTATYSGDGSFASSSSTPPVRLIVGCTTTVTGIHPALAITHGSVCLTQATITGSITITNGAILDIEGSTVKGALLSSGAATLRICGSTFIGSVGITQTSGLVVVGGFTDCAGNAVRGGLLAANNHGGGTIIGNTIAGGWVITNNSPPITNMANQ
jgi:hypothetical protein